MKYAEEIFHPYDIGFGLLEAVAPRVFAQPHAGLTLDIGINE
jgi:hypothetical protein